MRADVDLSFDETRVHCILLDVEGTTTPVDFVYRVLFPYARERVERFLCYHHNNPEVTEEIRRLGIEQATDAQRGLQPPDWQEGSPECRLESACRYIHWLMDRDSKSAALKALQGRIWEEGYRSGELHGDVYPDVPPAFSRWRKRNEKIAIFSSGSILAQKRLFETTAAGDLTAFIAAHFDTTTGPKREAKSYRRIIDTLSVAPSKMLFISDVVEELDAASDCGVETLLCVRPGQPVPEQIAHPIIHSFDEVLP
jgi:enolase-phosphatase E1